MFTQASHNYDKACCLFLCMPKKCQSKGWRTYKLVTTIISPKPKVFRGLHSIDIIWCQSLLLQKQHCHHIAPLLASAGNTTPFRWNHHTLLFPSMGNGLFYCAAYLVLTKCQFKMIEHCSLFSMIEFSSIFFTIEFSNMILCILHIRCAQCS